MDAYSSTSLDRNQKYFLEKEGRITVVGTVTCVSTYDSSGGWSTSETREIVSGK